MCINKATAIIQTIPNNIIKKLNQLIDDNKRFGQFSVNVSPCDGFDDAKWELDLKTRKMSIAAKNPSFAPFYNRVSVRSVQGCLLVDKCSSIETLDWFSSIELRSIDVFVKKFNHLSSDNENERMFKLLEKVIKESGKRGVSSKILLSKTRQVPSYVRKQALSELEETGTIHVEMKKVGNSRKASTVYFWIK